MIGTLFILNIDTNFLVSIVIIFVSLLFSIVYVFVGWSSVSLTDR